MKKKFYSEYEAYLHACLLISCCYMSTETFLVVCPSFPVLVEMCSISKAS